MFVFGDIVDPHPDVLKLVEDIVRNQVIEMLLQSRALATRRSSRYLSPEDLLFLIRYDRAKVNRLRTYLSWKDVRKNAKDSGDAGGAGADVGDGAGGDDGGGMDNPIRSRKMKIRLPWEISTVFSEYLHSGIAATAAAAQGEDYEEEDEDDIEAHQDSLQRLKAADEATRKMTRDEYVHYSECRQASFTFRKSKKFREFINAGAYLDVKPNDDIIDVLGFLSFEVVRELCVGAVAIKESFEEDAKKFKRLNDGSRSRKDMIESGQGIPGKQRDQQDDGDVDGPATNGTITVERNGSTSTTSSPEKKRKELSDSATTSSANSSPTKKQKQTEKSEEEISSETPCGLFTMPPAKSSPLMTSHVREAFARLQRDRSSLSIGSGGMAGGLKRTRVFVI
ncbi:TFIID-18kDa-domain-containing protein [Meira miltonrushii]|uniref:TFIID-18kDa-domain-containing protein n=1 Tax=Meira miltonrushii TaxID=1280837 RepID=A0A316VHE7_9BASI|nr:TFIID-18kDa-domain-containing protein [Meira miltonrushii]PWN34925.1 TFIID-18kDa-domain-containing protein [Meira miltonrushii]